LRSRLFKYAKYTDKGEGVGRERKEIFSRTSDIL